VHICKHIYAALIAKANSNRVGRRIVAAA